MHAGTWGLCGPKERVGRENGGGNAEKRQRRHLEMFWVHAGDGATSASRSVPPTPHWGNAIG